MTICKKKMSCMLTVFDFCIAKPVTSLSIGGTAMMWQPKQPWISAAGDFSMLCTGEKRHEESRETRALQSRKGSSEVAEHSSAGSFH